LLTFKIIQRI